MYRFEVLEMAIGVVAELRGVIGVVARKDGDLARQMKRCAASVAANIAEGNARVGKDKNHLWRVAMGSADELKTHLRVAEAFGYIELLAVAEPIEQLGSIARIMNKLSRA